MGTDGPEKPGTTKGVLLLVAFLLVVLGRGLQVAGAIGEGLVITYLSIGTTAIAAGLLVLALRRRP